VDGSEIHGLFSGAWFIPREILRHHGTIPEKIVKTLEECRHAIQLLPTDASREQLRLRAPKFWMKRMQAF
jgi:hypothetical protein